MDASLSKLCADFLRTSFAPEFKLKSSHAHELVAAFHGYKSQAAQLTDERRNPLSDLGEADILIPDVTLMDRRRKDLNGLPQALPDSVKLAHMISGFLATEKFFTGEILLDQSLESYITEQYLIEKHHIIEDELGGETASTNAAFSSHPYYNKTVVEDKRDVLVVTVTGIWKGDLDPDSERAYSGHEINLEVRVTLNRIAGTRGFEIDPEIEVSGAADKDWGDQNDYPDADTAEVEFTIIDAEPQTDLKGRMPYRSIPWSDWMSSAGVEFSEGSEVFALLDRNVGLIQAASDVPDPEKMMLDLQEIIGDSSLDLHDFQYVTIENARLSDSM